MTRPGHALEPFLPHRGGMLLLDAVVRADADGGSARVRLDAEAWYAGPDGSVPAWIGLEFIAQAIAACRGRFQADQAGLGGAPGGGYLLGTRAYRSAVPCFAAGADLDIQVALLDQDPSGLAVYHGEIHQSGRCLAEADLKVMLR